VRLELGAELLQVLHDRALDRLGEVGVVVGDEASALALHEREGREGGGEGWNQSTPLARAVEPRESAREGTHDAVEDVLDAALAEELVALAEGHLDDAAQLGELLGRV